MKKRCGIGMGDSGYEDPEQPFGMCPYDGDDPDLYEDEDD